VKFKEERGRWPELNSQDPWEKRLAEGRLAFRDLVAAAKAKADSNG
jgi:hypothetical protein